MLTMTYAHGLFLLVHGKARPYVPDNITKKGTSPENKYFRAFHQVSNDDQAARSVNDPSGPRSYEREKNNGTP